MSIMKSATWQDLSTEKFRTYHFPKGATFFVNRPKKLFVKASGSHRIVAENAEGRIVSYYIPAGWIGLSWEVYDGQDPFTF